MKIHFWILENYVWTFVQKIDKSSLGPIHTHTHTHKYPLCTFFQILVTCYKKKGEKNYKQIKIQNLASTISSLHNFSWIFFASLIVNLISLLLPWLNKCLHYTIHGPVVSLVGSQSVPIKFSVVSYHAPQVLILFYNMFSIALNFFHILCPTL